MKLRKFNENFEDNWEETPDQTIKNKSLFIRAIGTLFFSGGGDPSPEIFWGVNDLLDWYEKEFNVELNVRFDERMRDDDWYSKVIDAIKKS